MDKKKLSQGLGQLPLCGRCGVFDEEEGTRALRLFPPSKGVEIALATCHKQLESKRFLSPMAVDCLGQRSIKDVRQMSWG